MSNIRVAYTDRAFIKESWDGTRRQLELDYYLEDDPLTYDHAVMPEPEHWCAVMERLDSGETVQVTSRNYLQHIPCGGLLAVFGNGLSNPQTRNITHIGLVIKTQDSPRNPGYRCAFLGHPECRREWLHGGHIEREGLEEGIYLTGDHDLLLPSNDPTREIQPVMEAAAIQMEARTGLEIKGDKKVPMYIRGGRDTYRVLGRTNNVPVKEAKPCVLSWTPDEGLNAGKFLYIEYPGEDVRLIDGEMHPDGTPLMRDMSLIAIPDLVGRVSGQEIQEEVFMNGGKGGIVTYQHTVPIMMEKWARAALRQLDVGGYPVYGRDWLGEALEFFSNPEVQKQHRKGIPWHEIEKGYGGES